ncbi:MAG: repressor LexA, partial [Lysobacter sp.]
MSTLTDTRQTILALIAERVAEEGMPPSQAEIACAMGFSGVRAAQYHLEALEQAGVIERVPGKARGLRITPAGLAQLGSESASDFDDSAAPVRRD